MKQGASTEHGRQGGAGKKFPLVMQIFLALVLAFIAGLLLTEHANTAREYIKPFGLIFLNLLKFVVVPLVLFSIMGGIISLHDIRKVGAIGIKTMGYYLLTTAVAVSIGLAGAFVFKGAFPALATTGLRYEAQKGVNVMDTLLGIFPDNIIAPLYSSSMLQLIVMALLLGFAIILVGKEAECLERAVNSLNLVFMKCVELILKLSPIGVFCLFCPLVAENGSGIVGSLAMVLFVAYICYAVHAFLVYSLCVRIFARISPLTFFHQMSPAIIFAFSSGSSVGTLPLNIECARRLGADDEVSSFVLPLGATMNMDGTAIYQGVCAIFIASCYGIDLTLGQNLTIIFTATLASIGTAGVPGSGMLMLAMVLSSAGLPVDGIALVAGIDRIFDMGRTALNITGDASCAVIVSRWASAGK